MEQQSSGEHRLPYGLVRALFSSAFFIALTRLLLLLLLLLFTSGYTIIGNKKNV